MDMIAEKRKLKLTPASIKVVVCVRLPTFESFIMRNTVISAKTKAIIGTPIINLSKPKTIAKLAPKLAPELTPSI